MAYTPQARPPIVSPFYLQWERFPYLRGPNYVRPMFRENSRKGAFRSHPIERTLPPPMAGLGDAGLGGPVPWWCWETPLFKQAHGECWDKHPQNETARDACINKVINSACPWNRPPDGGDNSGGGGDALSYLKGDKNKGPKKDFVASVTAFFKDKQGKTDSLKIGLVALVGLVVAKQYKKGQK